MSGGGGSRAVVAALSANLGIAVIKFVAFGLTASTSMLAEGVHSLVDSGNQLLLLLGARRSRRPATEEHPFGYGRDRYVFAFLVALLLFSGGGLFAVFEGVQKIRHPHHLDGPGIALGVLGAALVLESFSLRTAVGEARQHREAAGNTGWLEFIRRAKAPELPIVLLEDVAALIGLAFAFAGVSLAAGTGDGVWDGVSTVAIGGLLITVAMILVVETKSLLLGESADPRTNSEIAAQLVGGPAGGVVERVIHLRTMHLGPDELLVAAKIAMRESADLPEIARAIDEAEARVRAAVPAARVIYLEPDLDRHRPGRP